MRSAKSILTVVITVHNTEMYLSRCLNTILNQSLKNIKVIIIDDCSTDNSYKLIQSYVQNDSRVQVIKNKYNLGPGKSRNLGLEKTDTKYVCFLDSDDWIDTNAFEIVLTELEGNESCDLAIYSIKTDYGYSNNSLMRYEYKHKNIINNRFALDLFSRTYSGDIKISALLGSKIFKTKLLKDNNIEFCCGYFEDILFTYKTILNAKKILLLPEVFMYYFQRNGSIMHTFSKKHIDDFIKVFVDLEKIVNDFPEVSSEKRHYYSLFDKCCNSLLNILFSVEQDEMIQKKYLYYLFNEIQHNLNLKEYLSFLDINRVKNFFYL